MLYSVAFFQWRYRYPGVYGIDSQSEILVKERTKRLYASKVIYDEEIVKPLKDQKLAKNFFQKYGKCLTEGKSWNINSFE